jgi:hypothetical protein
VKCQNKLKIEEKEQGRRKPAGGGGNKTENKRKRYDEKASVAPKISCKHSEKFCDAANLILTGITKFHVLYWANKDSVSQKNFLIWVIMFRLLVGIGLTKGKMKMFVNLKNGP